MALPSGAKLETVLPGGIAIYDVSDILPRPKRPRFNRRPPGVDIIRVFFHHSGAYGRDGFAGAEGSVRYVINNRNFGARPYHFWLAYKPDVDENGNIVIYRLGKDEERCWHTGNAANDNGVGCVWQGNLHPDHDGQPSPEQYRMAEALTNWLIKRYNLSLPNGLSFHAEAKKWGANKNKASCPGPYVRAWVEERRERSQSVESNEQPEPVAEEIEEPVQVITTLEPEPKKPKVKKPVSPPKKKNWLNRWIGNLFPGRKD